MASGNRLDRRSLVKVAGLGAVAALSRPGGWTSAAEPKANGHLKQSVCQWCYKDTPIEKLVENAKRIGYQSVELLTPDMFKALDGSGLTCAMLSGACTIGDGYNAPKNHDRIVESTKKHIDF